MSLHERAVVVGPRVPPPGYALTRRSVPAVPAGHVVVRVVRSALNRNDLMRIQQRAELPRPIVLGSDAAGVVAETGPGVTDVAAGDPVVVLPSVGWGDDDRVQSAQLEFLGDGLDGTHADSVVVPAENVFPKPARLSWDEAAALPLAGVTAWRALVTRGRLTAGEVVVVTAAGSGVGSIGIQVAASLGARVVAVSSSEQKLQEAIALGAHDAVLRSEAGLTDRLVAAAGEHAHLVLDSTGAQWPELLAALRPGGRLVSVGRNAGREAAVPVGTLFWRQLSLLGSSLGSPRDFSALLAHVGSSAWTPVVDSVHPLADVATAFARLDHPERFGKVVLAVSTPTERHSNADDPGAPPGASDPAALAPATSAAGAPSPCAGSGSCPRRSG